MSLEVGKSERNRFVDAATLLAHHRGVNAKHHAWNPSEQSRLTQCPLTSRCVVRALMFDKQKA
jgi:hypothetical protein